MSTRIKVSVTGQKELLAELRKFGDVGDEAGKRVLGAACARVVPMARALAPVEEGDGGALRDSIRTTKPTKTRAGRISAGVVAGGAPLRRLASERGRALPGSYGSIQHEDLTLKHKSGEAKFLEKPFFRVVNDVPDDLMQEVDALQKQGGP